MEIKNLLKARYRMLYIVTWEEARCVATIKGIADDMPGFDVFEWSLTSGKKKVGSDEPAEAIQDPGDILHDIGQANSKAVYILKDFHAFLDDASIVRALRDLTSADSENYKPIIITSPVMKVPVEIEKIMQVIDFDLPTREEIRSLIMHAHESICEKTGETDENFVNHCEFLIQACQGLTIDEIENVLAKSWVETGELNVDIILNEKKQIIRKSGVLEYFDNLEQFSDVGGMDLLKAWIVRRATGFSEKAREFKLPTPKGILLMGVSGSGKSLLCKSVAGLWKMPIIRLDVGRVMQGIVGSSEENMRRAIRMAESIAPCILF